LACRLHFCEISALVTDEMLGQLKILVLDFAGDFEFKLQNVRAFRTGQKLKYGSGRSVMRMKRDSRMGTKNAAHAVRIQVTGRVERRICPTFDKSRVEDDRSIYLFSEIVKSEIHAHRAESSSVSVGPKIAVRHEGEGREKFRSVRGVWFIASCHKRYLSPSLHDQAECRRQPFFGLLAPFAIFRAVPKLTIGP
jgi:hypothetical protein